MPAPKLPRAKVIRMLEEGMGPTEIQAHLRDHDGIQTTTAAISTIRRRHTDIPPANSNPSRVLPWKIRPEHEGSSLRHAYLAWAQREKGHPLSAERTRNLAYTEAKLMTTGQVIHYSPAKGFILVPARPGIDLGIIREPDDARRPPMTGPYATVLKAASPPPVAQAARHGIVQALGEARGRRNITKTRLGELAGVTRNTNLKYLKGETSIPAETLIAYARALEVDPGTLIARAVDLMEG
jgi:2-aminoadipate transaminase